MSAASLASARHRRVLYLRDAAFGLVILGVGVEAVWLNRFVGPFPFLGTPAAEVAAAAILALVALATLRSLALLARPRIVLEATAHGLAIHPPVVSRLVVVPWSHVESLEHRRRHELRSRDWELRIGTRSDEEWRLPRQSLSDAYDDLAVPCSLVSPSGPVLLEHLEAAHRLFGPATGGPPEAGGEIEEPVEVWRPPAGVEAVTERLEISHGGLGANLVLRLIGAPMLLLGLGLFIGAAQGLVVAGGAEPLATAIGLGGGAILGIVGVTLTFGSSGVTLERGKGIATEWFSVLRRFPRRVEPLASYSRVTVRRQVGLTATRKRGGNLYGRSFLVYPVSLENGSRSFVLAEPRSHGEARGEAEEVARFLGWRLEDFVGSAAS